MVLSITDRARSQLQSVAVQESINLDKAYLRLAVIQGGCSGLTYDLGWDTEIKYGDEQLEVNGLSVVIDRRSRLYLDGAELDFTDGLEGKGFHFSNPQASRTCACGESFGL
ncbi:MAG: iron-sulfur cluster assembly accessory protein [Rhodothermaceae bacterium]|nr:iron-sulfur cluster assembly accessory protein [Rhodothermaceae bacterium]MXX59435.1 iron-sulfur cluster assembly accessory protein [Rhodothermaceae bacterium]MYD20449.1 iron-sulfur cluster assembly accessory protein [Rhodothermaceae bacterium]MYD56382.1 iron-sulfur cluster assembly accessory protein [Rhodothermaceae bacterium]MYF40978.1 iron-sulfur cluster assembly accessory protein [Rhodothermaceae bacterium]